MSAHRTMIAIRVTVEVESDERLTREELRQSARVWRTPCGTGAGHRLLSLSKNTMMRRMDMDTKDNYICPYTDCPFLGDFGGCFGFQSANCVYLPEEYWDLERRSLEFNEDPDLLDMIDDEAPLDTLLEMLEDGADMDMEGEPEWLGVYL